MHTHTITTVGAISAAILFLVVFLGVSVPQHAAASTNATILTPQAILGSINSERIRHGLAPLRVDPQLNAAAYAKATDMMTKGYFAHNGPDGTAPWHWIENTGYTYRYAGENLAIGFEHADAQHAAWMDSEFHRRNILNMTYADTGIAILMSEIRGQPEVLVVQFFAARNTGVTTLITPPTVHGMWTTEADRSVASVYTPTMALRQALILSFLTIEAIISAMIALPLLRRRTYHGALAFGGAVL